MTLPHDQDVVEKLVLAAFNAMEALPDTYDDKQLLSAVFTICIRTIDALTTTNPNMRPACRQAVEILMLKTAGGPVN